MFNLLIITILLIFAPAAIAENLYTDNSCENNGNGTLPTCASSPGGNGAWNSFANTVFGTNAGQVGPGDTLYISGGPVGGAGQTYTEDLQISQSGTVGVPVTIRTGQDAATGGKVIILGNIYYGLRDSGTRNRNNIVVNGEYNGTRNIRVDNSTTHINTPCIDATNSQGWGVRLLYLELVNCGTRVELDEEGEVINPPVGTHGSAIQIYGPTPTSGVISSNPIEIAYCYISNVGHEAITISSGYAVWGDSSSWDQILIHHNEIPNATTNTITTGAGVTIYNNYLGLGAYFTYTATTGETGIHWATVAGSADTIEPGGGDYVKIYNNHFVNANNCAIFIRFGVFYGLTMGGHTRVYNNLFVGGHWSICLQGTYNLTPTPGREMTITDVFVMNNTSISNIGKAHVLYPRANYCDTIYLDDVRIENNLIYNCAAASDGYGLSITYSGDPNLTVKNNLLDGTVANSKKVNYNGTTYSTGEAFDAAIGDSNVASGNSSATVVFEDPTNSIYRLHSSDIAARDKGKSQSTIFTTDKQGFTRPQGTAWDIGAYEFLYGQMTGGSVSGGVSR